MAMEREIAKAVWGLIEPKLDKKLAAMEERILSKIQGGQNEQLLTVQEASRRLNVNQATIRALVASGELVMKSPNGRNKVLESSINSYIGRLQEKAG